MSVIAFCNNEKEETGQTLSIVAISTYLAIEHNYKVLVISTGLNDKTLDNCFWQEKTTKKNLGLFGPNTNTAMQEGITGLARIIKSNRVAPESITNYTKTVFKERLEILQAFNGEKSDYDEMKKVYPDIIATANKYYDLIFVDVDRELGEETIQKIMGSSNLVVTNLTQRLTSINNYIKLREKMAVLSSEKNLILIGRYDKFSKYSVKNISRYMKEKNNVLTIPYNTLFFEACEEARVPDLFLKLRKVVTDDDRNGFFIAEVGRATENIIYRLKGLNVRI